MGQRHEGSQDPQVGPQVGVRAVVPSGPTCPSLLPSHHISLLAWCYDVLGSTCILHRVEPGEGTDHLVRRTPTAWLSGGPP